ncbi:DNA repair protein RecO [Bartonella quintana]|uniref:DNA repair protein RecO n=2 Tax=Bartonella quintana TaxID=803 RepID=RECO_BARQU|nr:DNA repair protein RecO [Bartonella quintana]Q6G080.1 RecName: Full=DNA repair protein RecO; AltName: Full=Recombination protein O [Bartonella quintana str. Toulouse]ETS11675.1 DNA repair protein recO [Bartonella quintana BQ2-D70]ETS18170.1 DNA repair protein recO [Bartonella quintana JK 7]ETS18999.1 DNA repair protein recO [Bartonella quintana JK 12]KEC60011.1 DNA repair protein recO [Bartonella quintana JK 19]KEC60528.1 DNA repair protein recO [Bartonella quintana JK 31]
MKWKEQAVILGTRQYGETSIILEVMTRQHGRYMGIVKGGHSRRMAGLLQPGNFVEAEWWARLDEHLGLFRLEALDLYAARLILLPEALYALQLIVFHLRLLPERDPYPSLYDILHLFMQNFDESFVNAELLVRFEMRLLEELGFGLDLSRCAATGRQERLFYVSPKSGRAVCEEAGRPWKEKLLTLPQFLVRRAIRPVNFSDIINGFILTGFFLMRHVWEPRGIKQPSVRVNLIQLFERRFRM